MGPKSSVALQHLQCAIFIEGLKVETESWRLSIPGGMYTSHASSLKDRKRLQKADSQATSKEKKRRQGLQLVRTRREEDLCEMEGVTYEAGGF